MAKKLKIPEIPAIVTDHAIRECMFIDPEWIDKIEPMDPRSLELFMLKGLTTLTKTEVDYVVR